MSEPNTPPDSAENTGGEKTPPDAGTPEQMPPSVAAVIARHKHVAKLFAGTAKGTGADGQELINGTPPESYDLTFVVALVRHGIRDYDVLARALSLRPGGHAAQKGVSYVSEIIARAVETAGQGEAPAGDHDFTVEDVTVYRGDQTKFTLGIKVDGRAVPVTFGVSELLKPLKFQERCFDQLLLNVRIQKGWRQIVEGWMKSARVVTPPSEITREGAIKLAVERALGRMSIGESFDDLRDARGVIAEQRGRKVLLFEIGAVQPQLRSQDLAPPPSLDELYRALIDLGARHGRPLITFDGTKKKTPTRCWLVVAPKELLDTSIPSPPPRPTPTKPPEGLL